MKTLKKVILMVAIFLAVLIISNVSKAATVKVTGETLNVRKEASTSSDVIAMLSKDIECELLGEEGDFYKIKYKNYVGYVSKKYAEVIGKNGDNTLVEGNTNEQNTINNENVSNSENIDNSQSSSELTDENTVKELYIDNISMTAKSQNGTKILNYKNPLNFGKYKDIDQSTNNRIDFKIINTNQENENNNYDEPTFYSDCSNPISLGFLNKNILTNYSISDTAKTISFNGKVLKEANINLEDINYILNFTIHIVNNLDEKFAYNMKLDVNLDGIYDGYSYKGKTTTGKEYAFFKEINNL